MVFVWYDYCFASKDLTGMAIATVARCLPPSVEIAVLEGDSAGEIVPRHRPPPVEIAVLEEESAVEISTMSRQSC